MCPICWHSAKCRGSLDSRVRRGCQNRTQHYEFWKYYQNTSRANGEVLHNFKVCRDLRQRHTNPISRQGLSTQLLCAWSTSGRVEKALRASSHHQRLRSRVRQDLHGAGPCQGPDACGACPLSLCHVPHYVLVNSWNARTASCRPKDGTGTGLGLRGSEGAVKPC